MTTMLMGIGLLAASGAIIYPFIPAEGVDPNRNEWIDIMVAIAASALLAGGVALILLGIANFAS